MNKLYSSLSVLFLLFATFAGAQSWTVYEADVTPDLADPAWSESNTKEFDYSWGVVSDPDDSGNNLLEFNSLIAGGGAMWKTADFSPVPTALTAVLRVKQNDVAADRLVEIDMHINGVRDQLVIRANNQITLQRSDTTIDVVGLDVSEWNVFRITMDASAGTSADVNVYLNEGSEPILTVTSTTTTGSNYFRFGDGNSSPTYSALIDFVAYDETGAYSPSDFSLPDGLVPGGEDEGDWIVYNADVTPDLASPAWSESNTKEFDYSWEVVADPSNSSNNLLEFNSLIDGGGAMWKTADFDPVPTALTSVFRVKQNDLAADRLIEMDMHINGIRDQLVIRANNQISLQRSDTTIDVAGLDVSKWNVFRITIDASSGTEGLVNVYLNEGTEPILSVTSTTTTGSKYIRFGDGNSSPAYSSFIDFVAYDASGAYAPDDLSLPEGLIPGIPEGDWITYTADVTPDLSDPAWSESNTKEFDYSWGVVADPDVDGNNLLEFNSLIAGGGAMWKTADFDPVPTALTSVFRVKQNDLSADRVLEMDMHINGIRDQLVIRGNNQISLQRSDTTIDVAGLDVTKWNVFRISIDASSGTSGDVNVYLNENPIPILSVTSTTTTGSKYIRFGDGNSSPTYSAFIDFVSYDVSGAYGPDETALPQGLIPTPKVGDWSLYTADVTPDLSDPAWSESNTKEFEYSWDVVADPDVEGNNLLEFNSLIAGGGAMWKTADFDPVPSALTAVFRVKQNDETADRLVEMDMHINGIRDQLIIRANNQISLQRSDTTIDVAGLDVSEWNVFRISIDAGSGTEGLVNVYLNEKPVPILSVTSTTTTSSKYIRFGDGNSSPTYSSFIDFVAYDETGAFDPQQRILPPGLIPGSDDNEGPVPTIRIAGSIDALSQDVGYDPDFSVDSYTILGADLTGDITITPPADFEVSLNQTDWFSATNPLVLSPSSGAVGTTDVFVRLNASAVGDYSGDITHASDGAEEVKVAVSGTAVNLVPEIALTGDFESFSQNLSTASASQIYRVSGENLKGAITVTATDNFEVSLDGETWSTEVAIDPSDRTLANTQVMVRLNASALGDYSGEIVHSSTDAENVSLAVTGTVIPDPGINVVGSISAFSQSVGDPSESQSYTISGTNLSGNITISLPEHFEVSFNDEVWLPSLTLAPLEGSLDELTLYVRLNATANGNYSGEIVHSSIGVDPVSIAVSGTAEAGVVLGGAENMTTAFSVWPNPSTDRITLERKDFANVGQVSIYTLSGTKQTTHIVGAGNQTMKIDVSHLPHGVYLVEYISGVEKTRMKLIKSK